VPLATTPLTRDIAVQSFGTATQAWRLHNTYDFLPTEQGTWKALVYSVCLCGGMRGRGGGSGVGGAHRASPRWGSFLDHGV